MTPQKASKFIRNLSVPSPNNPFFLRSIANHLIFSNSYEVKEIVRETSKEVFRMDTEMGSNHYMSGVKHPYDHSERPFNERSCSADGPISAFVFCWDWFTTNRSFHSLVNGGKRNRSEILSPGKQFHLFARDRSGCHEVMQVTYRTFGRTGVLYQWVNGVYTKIRICYLS